MRVLARRVLGQSATMRLSATLEQAMSSPPLSTADPSGVPEPARPDSDSTDASVEASRAVHRDAVHLAHAELRTYGLSLVGLGSLTLAAITLLANAGSTRSILSLLMLFGAFAAVRTAQTALDVVKLRHADPDRLLRQERQATDDEVAAVADIQSRQSAMTPVMTYALCAVIVSVTAVQFVTGLDASIDAAALVKPLVWQGEWWRLLSAAYLHGSVVHLVFNVSACRFLAGLVESHDRPLRIPLVFLTAALGGSAASTVLLSMPSLGASGGILGLVGYLLVAGRRQQTVAAAWIRSRMRKVLIATAAYGILGFFFIDNAAHAGGAIAGYLVGLATVPHSDRPQSAERTRRIDQLSRASLVVLLAGAAYTVMRLVRHS